MGNFVAVNQNNQMEVDDERRQSVVPKNGDEFVDCGKIIILFINHWWI